MKKFSVFCEPRSLRRSTRGTISGAVYVDFDGTPFPDEEWTDFVVVILGWWLEEILTAKVGMILRFTEGPYLVRARDADGENLVLDCIESRRTDRVRLSAMMRLDEVRNEIRRAGRMVFSECQRRGWSCSDVDRLSSLLR